MRLDHLLSKENRAGPPLRWLASSTPYLNFFSPSGGETLKRKSDSCHYSVVKASFWACSSGG